MSAKEPTTLEMSENRSWLSIHSLLADDANASIAVVGLPLVRESITPGRCDLAPGAVRNALRRFSVYDLETETDLSGLRVFDTGDLPIAALTPEEAFDPITKSVRTLCANHALTVLLGGNNAITRPGAHGVHADLKRVGLLTLDAHFDLRDTDGGLNNGNPIQALLEDGFPGVHISQIGLAPFANTKKAHEKARAAGISVCTLSECFARGFVAVVREELDRLAHSCEHIYVDFDIDVIERAEMPAAPGARPGGISARDFFAAVRVIAAHPKVKCVDLAEFDPGTDVNATGALTAGRWFAEILAGFTARTK
ncbi:MAG TPA: agmatinase family protein [Rhizomicrobium sp.]